MASYWSGSQKASAGPRASGDRNQFEVAIRPSNGIRFVKCANLTHSKHYDYGWKFDHSGESHTGGALVPWDIWDGQLTRAKVHEAQANLEMAREEERKLDLEEERKLDLEDR
jgi:hypothetical protein